MSPRDPRACTPADRPLTQAERTARRAAFRASVQPIGEARAYVPNDDERAATHRACRGIADGWPIPLTPCK